MTYSILTHTHTQKKKKRKNVHHNAAISKPVDMITIKIIIKPTISLLKKKKKVDFK